MEPMSQTPLSMRKLIRLSLMLLFVLGLLLPGMALAQPTQVQVCKQVLDNGDANTTEGGDFRFTVANQDTTIANEFTINRNESQPATCAAPSLVPPGSTLLTVIESATFPANWLRNAPGYPLWEITDGNTTFNGTGQVAEISGADLAALSGTATVTFTNASGRQVTQVCKEAVDNGDGTQTPFTNLRIGINTAPQIVVDFFDVDEGTTPCETVTINLPLGADLETAEAFSNRVDFGVTPGFPEIVIEEVNGAGSLTEPGNTLLTLGATNTTDISGLSGDLRVTYRNRWTPFRELRICKVLEDNGDAINHGGAFFVRLAGGLLDAITLSSLTAAEDGNEVCITEPLGVDPAAPLTELIEQQFPAAWESNAAGYPRWEVLRDDGTDVRLFGGPGPDAQGTALFDLDWTVSELMNESQIKVRIVNRAAPFGTGTDPTAQALMRVCKLFEDDGVAPVQTLPFAISAGSDSGAVVRPFVANLTEGTPTACLASLPVIVNAAAPGAFGFGENRVDEISWETGFPLAELYNQPVTSLGTFVASTQMQFNSDGGYSGDFAAGVWQANQDYTLQIRNRIDPDPVFYELCLRVDTNGDGDTETAITSSGALGGISLQPGAFSTAENTTECLQPFATSPGNPAGLQPLPNIANPWNQDLIATFLAPAGPDWPGLDYLPLYGSRTGFSELSLVGNPSPPVVAEGTPSNTQTQVQALNPMPGDTVRQTFVIRPAANLRVCKQVLANGDAIDDSTDVVLSSVHEFGITTAQDTLTVIEGGALECIETRRPADVFGTPFSLIGNDHSATEFLPNWNTNTNTPGFPIWRFDSTGPVPFSEQGIGEDTGLLDTRRTAADSGDMTITFFNRQGPDRFVQLCKEVQDNGDLPANQGGTFNLTLSSNDPNNPTPGNVNLTRVEGEPRFCSAPILVPRLTSELRVIETEPPLSAAWPGSDAGFPEWFVENTDNVVDASGNGLATEPINIGSIGTENFRIVFRNRARVNVPPTVVKTFAPDSIPTFGVSQLTLTLSNNNPLPATLLADLVDNLPADVVIANPANAATNCPAGVVTAPVGDVAVTLGTGAQIPAGAPGTCTVTVDVTSAAAGVYTNLIAANELRTDLGNNQSPTSAELTVRAPGAISVEKVEIGGPAAANWAFTISTATSGCDVSGQTSWPLSIAAGGGTQSQPALPVFSRDDNVTPCSYTVSETVQAGWDVTALQCDNGTPNLGNAQVDGVQLVEGGTINCAFENTQITGTIIVEKQTDPDGAPDQFTFTGAAAGLIADNGQIIVPGLTPGTYTSTEGVLAGWDLTGITCDDTNSSGDILTRTATFVLEANETVTCRFDNRQQRGTIIVEKQTDPDGAPDQFTFTGAAAGAIVDNGQLIVTDLVPGNYSSTEMVPPGWDLTAITCDDANSSGDVGTATANFVLEANETVTCVFDNRQQRGTIIVAKQTNPDGAPDSFTFSGDVNGAIMDDQQIMVSDLLPGNYSAMEALPAGWSLSSIVCDDTNSTGDVGTATANFVLDPGETVTCTFNNTQGATIIVEKQTDPDGATQSFTFSGDVAGAIADNQQLIVSGLAAGNYSSMETVPVDWDLTSIVCNDTDSSGDVGTATANFVVDAGETVICTFNNRQQRGTIIVEKQTDPDGAPDLFTFTGDAAGAIADNDQLIVTDLVPGNYSSMEIVPPGWDLTAITCDDANSSGDVGTATANFVLEANETVTCVFDNRQQRGTIIVEKQTDPDGAPDSFTFSGEVNGAIMDNEQIMVSDLLPGDYSATETLPAGWSLSSIVCDDTNSTGDVGTATANFVLDPGETVTCVFNNTQGATIIVEKQTDPDGATDSFTFTGDVAGAIADNEQLIVSGLDAGSYTSTEDVLADWDLTAISCNDTDSTGDVGTRTATFVVDAGETVICTFENRQQRGTIVIEKQTDPDGAPDTFTFTGDAAGELTDNEQITVSDLVPGDYSSTEMVPPGWELSSIVCDDANSSGDVGTATANFVLEANETVTCVFNNTQLSGGIQVTKVVTGNSANAVDWVFTLDVNDPVGCDISGVTNPLTIPAAGGSGVFADLLAVNVNDSSDCVYEVSETEQAGWVVQEANPQTGITITPGSNVDLTFTNIEQGGVTVSKNVTGATEGYVAGSEFEIAFDCDNDAFDRNVLLTDGAIEGPFDIDTGTACTVTEPGLPDPLDSGDTYVGYAWDTPVITPPDFTVTGGDAVAVSVDNLLNRTQIAVADPVAVGCAMDFAVATFTITVFNGGTDALTDLQLVNDLESTFALSPTGYSLDSVESADLSINPAFDGNADTNMLLGTDVLPPGASASIEVSVTVLTAANFLGIEFVNQVIASGTGDVTQLEVSDLSHFEFNSDPSLDQPTTFQINCEVLMVPVMNRWGLLLMALLLLVVGIVIQEKRNKA
ncbi:MAG: hypothetical protein AAF446_00215 [Pseudomonadota bacterium]